MSVSKCKEYCHKWSYCEGCRACKWVAVCRNAYRYLSDEETEVETKKSEE